MEATVSFGKVLADNQSVDRPTTLCRRPNSPSSTRTFAQVHYGICMDVGGQLADDSQIDASASARLSGSVAIASDPR
jgi:hypothetical protein